MQDEITKAATILKQGGIVIFPTDTAFGIGCRIDDEQAIRRLFRVRQRPETQATPVLVSNLEMAQDYLQLVSEKVKKALVEKYWPGALTIVLPCQPQKVPELVRGGTQTLGVRMPNHAMALELIKQVNVPLLGPSANFHGEKTPYAFEELDPELIRLVDFVLSGECTVKQASTVIDATVEPWRILRQGSVILSKDVEIQI